MRIVVIARCLNEERNVKMFCSNYSWADAIVLSDGGSTDRTLEIAARFPNVVISHFNKKADLVDGRFMNPENDHLNHAIQEGRNLDADWLVCEDLDSFPNYLLYPKVREYFQLAETQGKIEVFSRRYYMWGYKEYFPKLASDNPIPGSVNPMHSIWAWHRTATICGNKPGEKFIEFGGLSPNIDQKLFFPDNICLLHYAWPNEKIVQEKMARYASWGAPQLHPFGAFGPTAPALDFMKPVFRYDEDV